jgi:hypothetical protein
MAAYQYVSLKSPAVPADIGNFKSLVGVIAVVFAVLFKRSCPYLFLTSQLHQRTRDEQNKFSLVAVTRRP